MSPRIFAAVPFLCMACWALLAGVRLGLIINDGNMPFPGPGLWPIAISIVLLACTAILIYRTLRMKPEKDTKIDLWTTGTRRVYLTMGILFLYLLVLPFLGFIISTFVLELIFIQWFAKKNPIITVVISAAITMVVYCAFRFALNVPVHTFGIFTI